MGPAPVRDEEPSSEGYRAIHRLRVAAPIVAGVIAGAFFGLRALLMWTRGGPAERVPTAGLLYLGSFLLVGGLLFLHRGVWRWMHDGNIRAMRTLSARSGRGPTRRWSPAVRGLQGWMVAREEGERDSRERRIAAAITLLVAGAVVVGYALLR